MPKDPPQLLRQLFANAVAAVHPRQLLPDQLPAERDGRLIVIGAGKAAAAMAEVLEQHWRGEISGLVVTPYGHGACCRQIERVEAAHPLPDAVGERFARRVLQRVSGLTENDRVMVLLSGGGSALLALPAEGITLADKQAISRALLLCGAAIGEINCVRKHLSAIKGGRLARACWPAQVHSYAISDVPGDDPAVIASGPTVADPSSAAEALAILARYRIEVPAAVRAWLMDPRAETLKPGAPELARSHFQLLAGARQALQAAAATAEAAGYACLNLGELQGEAREVAKVHAGIVRQILQYGEPVRPPCVLLSGGETTVSVRGRGRGGRNGEFLLSLTDALRGLPGVYALAADSDGIDGSEDNAGALMTPQTYAQGERLGLSTREALDANDSYGYFAALGALLVTGPTRTNVNDIRAILILPPAQIGGVAEGQA